MAKIRPFDASGWFGINNAVFDVVMPHLSPSAWKVLCVAIRQTWGWAADSSGQKRRVWDRISYSQFQAKTGISSRQAVSNALRECLEAGYLLRRQVGTCRGKPAYVYSLNREYELESPDGASVVPVGATEETTGTEFVPVTGTDSVPVTGTDSVLTKQRKQTKQSDGGGSSIIQSNVAASLEALTMVGVTRGVAERLAANCDPDQVCRWVAYAQQGKGIKDPAGLVVARLQAGAPAPEPSQDSGRQAAKTATCPDCWRVFPVESICPDCHRCYDCCRCAD